MTVAYTVVVGTAVLQISADQLYQDNLPLDHEAIRYAEGPLDNPVARLAEQLERGATTLDFREDGFGYLPSLLDHLGVRADSQALVFSKTSFQEAQISPRNPRAIYFSDNAAIAFVRGGELIELAAVDPGHGVVFYTLDARRSDVPTFARPGVCLQCHQGPATLGVPGMYVSSVFTSPSGKPDFGLGSIVTDHRTAFQDRWGGWYVTGTHGAQRHNGNAVALDPSNPGLLETAETQNLITLVKKFDTTRHLTPTSDSVALLTLEHQTQMTNMMTRLSWEARIATHEGHSEDAVRNRLSSGIEELVAYMLFVDEPRLAEPIEGVSTFARTFAERGPRDRQGRSLRDFDLQTRLFRYPLSYMVYSRSFDALPDTARARVARRLYDVLTGSDRTTRFASVSDDDRLAVFEILRDTKPNLPGYWGRASAP